MQNLFSPGGLDMGVYMCASIGYEAIAYRAIC